MGTTYELANDVTVRLIHAVLIKHHADLDREGVTIQALIATCIDKETGEVSQALRMRNYPIAAKIQVTSYQDRVRGIADVKLTIDDSTWRGLAATRREALIDHELTHCVLTRDRDGFVKRDDLGRPKLHIRPHDFELGWFTEIAERHGEAAIEVREVQRFHERWGQFCLFPMPGTTTSETKVETKVEISGGNGNSVTTDLETLRKAADNAHHRGRVGSRKSGEADERDPAVVKSQEAPTSGD